MDNKLGFIFEDPRLPKQVLEIKYLSILEEGLARGVPGKPARRIRALKDPAPFAS
jgi:hypothetical protein